MSGPALRDIGSHHAIHEAAWLEAEEMTDELRACLNDAEPGRFLAVARVLLEQWETRTLRHALAEEEPGGLYVSIAARGPEQAEKVAALRRDHEILHRMVGWIRELTGEPGTELVVCGAFETLLQLSAWHNADEERVLCEQASLGEVSQ